MTEKSWSTKRELKQNNCQENGNIYKKWPRKRDLC
jgi:hypothetical protein